MGVPEVRTYNDLARHAVEVRDRGFRALKTNILPFENGRLASYVPGFGRTPGWPELNWDNKLTRGVSQQLSTIREAVGPDIGIHLDINFNFKTEGLVASMADVHEINVARHNFYGHFCSPISATFAAVVPNFGVMEIDIDSAPWRDEFYTSVPTIEDGEYILSTAPGWGIDVDEKAVRAHPPRS